MPIDRSSAVLGVARAPHHLYGISLALGAALFAACGTAGPTDPSTGVLVQVRRGPIAPVQMDTGSNTAPVSGATVLLTGGRGTDTGTTDTTGTVRVLAFPGAYQVTVETCPGAMRTPQPAAVTVVQGSFVSALLVCDTGIR
jgi:hypothetical protein